MKLLLFSGACVAAIVAPQIVVAQDVRQAQQLEEVVVTAERRAENMQRVPISVAAVTTERLETTAITHSQDLSALVPGFVAVTTIGYATPFLRGIGSSSTGAGQQSIVATYVDGVYFAATPAGIFSLNDIERIEVLKGPQGTLFGRNATGGVVQVITRDPAPGMSGTGSLTYGNYEAWRLNGYVSGGTDKVAASLSLQLAEQGQGYGKNVATGNDVNQVKRDNMVRAKLKLSPNDNLTIRVAADYSDRSDSTVAVRLMPEYPVLTALVPSATYYSDSRYDINQGEDPFVTMKNKGGSIQVNYLFSGMELVDIVAYRESTFRTVGDVDFTPLHLIFGDLIQKDRQFTNEVQLRSTGDGDLTWIVGAFYIDASSDYDPRIVDVSPPFAPVPIRQFQTTKLPVESTALFGQIGWRFAPDTRLTVGLRHTWESTKMRGQQQFVGLPFPPTIMDKSISAEKWTWRLALDHQFTDRILGYVSYNRGFKGGGLNATDVAGAGYSPEQIDAYEVGVKSTLFDGSLRLNVAAFYYDYSNIQTPSLDPVTASIIINNAGKASIYGADFDIEAILSENVSIFGGAEVLHSEYDEYKGGPRNFLFPGGGYGSVASDLSGNTLPYAPEVTFNMGMNLHMKNEAGEFSLVPLVSYSSSIFGSPDNVIAQDAYAMINLTANWKSPDDRYSFSLWGRNLTDEHVATSLSPFAIGAIAIYKPPRTYGATFTVRY